jgi:hypothetical protein
MTVDQANEAELNGDSTRPAADLTGCRDGFTGRTENVPVLSENVATPKSDIHKPPANDPTP